MKPRARRVTLAAAALGVGVIGVLVVAQWGMVRDHVEGWWFLLSTETRTILGRKLESVPLTLSSTDTVQGIVSPLEWSNVLTARDLLGSFAAQYDRPVVSDPKFLDSIVLGMGAHHQSDSEQLEAAGWRLVALQLPRVIVAYPPAQQ